MHPAHGMREEIKLMQMFGLGMIVDLKWIQYTDGRNLLVLVKSPSIISQLSTSERILYTQ